MSLNSGSLVSYTDLLKMGMPPTKNINITQSNYIATVSSVTTNFNINTSSVPFSTYVSNRCPRYEDIVPNTTPFTCSLVSGSYPNSQPLYWYSGSSNYNNVYYNMGTTSGTASIYIAVFSGTASVIATYGVGNSFSLTSLINGGAYAGYNYTYNATSGSTVVFSFGTRQNAYETQFFLVGAGCPSTSSFTALSSVQYSNVQATVCSGSYNTIYIAKQYPTITNGITVYTNSSLTTVLTGFTYIVDATYGQVFSINTSTGVVGGIVQSC